MTTQTESRTRPLIFIIHFAFLICGIGTVLVGQILPVLTKRLSLSDAEAGELFVAQYAGSICGTILFGFAAKRFGFIKTAIFGFLLITAGSFLLNAESRFRLCRRNFYQRHRHRNVTRSDKYARCRFKSRTAGCGFSILNFFWGIGAIISQPFVTFFGTPDSIFVPTLILSVLFFSLAVAFLFFPLDAGKAVVKNGDESTVDSPVWIFPLAWLIALFNFIHVGFESGAGGWLTTYSERFPEGANSLLTATPAFFLFLRHRSRNCADFSAIFCPSINFC